MLEKKKKKSVFLNFMFSNHSLKSEDQTVAVITPRSARPLVCQEFQSLYTSCHDLGYPDETFSVSRRRAIAA